MVPNHRDKENLSGQRVSGRVQTCFDEKEDTLLRHRNATPLAGRVQIPGLGIFTFTRQRLQVGNNKFIFLKRPVFVLAEKLVQLHRLEQNKIYTPGYQFLPGTCDGGKVESSSKFGVEFTFKGIGVLVIRESKVKMRFYKDFLSTVDGSGNLVKALTNPEHVGGCEDGAG
ncbi:coiled-coil domain-containing protein 81-like [Rhynchocyon petersi]